MRASEKKPLNLANQPWLCARRQEYSSLHALAVIFHASSACLSSGYACWLYTSHDTFLLYLLLTTSFSMADVIYGVLADQRQDPLPLYVLAQEFDIVKQAFYTEPHDQSSWLYLRWLLSNALTRWQRAKGTPAEADARQVSLPAPTCATLACRPNTELGLVWHCCIVDCLDGHGWLCSLCCSRAFERLH